jgi:uncharacterized protein (TIGR03382 family)
VAEAFCDATAALPIAGLGGLQAVHRRRGRTRPEAEEEEEKAEHHQIITPSVVEAF